ncbi:MAG: phosphatidylserine decarboxylase family protein [Bacteroidales bacterium]|nr:phosphatidylserine decarboxylase family protein [Bacteroidales bacterium]
MKFHKEGHRIIAQSVIIFAGLLAMVILLPIPMYVKYVLYAFFVSMIVWTFFFFRVPEREINSGDHILSSADGEIVTIEEIYEPEYFKEKRLQISVFMSGIDVHVNWYPFEGTIKYTNYHEGKYLLARHPKSSEKNERSSIVLEKEEGKDVLIRQVAGIMARRIVYYGKPGDKVEQGEELGIIRFGSRVDFFLPVGTVPNVKIGQKVRAQRTVLAHFSE